MRRVPLLLTVVLLVGSSCGGNQSDSSVSVSDLVWERSEKQVEGNIRSVVAGGPGFIAVGMTSGDDDDENPAAWVSTDGLTWTSVPVEGTFDSSFETMNSVAPGGPGFVAVGVDTFIEFDRRWDAAVWVSDDGMSWQRVSHPALSESEAQEMWGLTHSGSDLTAVGFSMEVDTEVDTAVWGSSDGLHWERTSRDSLTTPSDAWIPDDNEPTVVHGPNGYVAIGSSDEAQAVWHSTDGRNWEQIPDSSLPSADAAYLYAITATDRRYAAVGQLPLTIDDQDVVVWLSDDGLVWNQIVLDYDGHAVAGAITTFGDEIVVVGFDVDKGTDIIWYSTDGEDWSTLTSPAFDNANGLPLVAYADDNRIIILGVDRPIVGRP